MLTGVFGVSVDPGDRIVVVCIFVIGVFHRVPGSCEEEEEQTGRRKCGDDCDTGPVWNVTEVSDGDVGTQLLMLVVKY